MNSQEQINTTIAECFARLPQDFQYTFQESKKVYPCSFDPILALKIAPGRPEEGISDYCYLPSEAKRLWFHTYCHEHGKVGRILTHCDNITLDNMNNVQARFAYVIGSAEVYIDDVVVGTSTAGQYCSVDDPRDLNGAIQTVLGIAQSKALTNAGFGIVGGTVSELPAYNPTAPAGYDQAPLPFTMGAAPVNGQYVPSPVQHVQPPQNVPAPAPYIPSAPAPVTPPAPPAPFPLNPAPPAPIPAPAPIPQDPVEAAKAVRYPCKGNFFGTTLGELLETRPQNIEYLASKYPREGPEKQAAMLLLNEALKRQGKPVPKR